jgi:dTDP-glucose 4,6-dehydratase|tara:strand:- start:1251 stop:2246 length:996 start_codon:yes stop_codon:yes gene_type:complete
MIFVTGGAGFIGSNFILKWLNYSEESILNIDNLSYAANLKNLSAVEKDIRYKFEKVNIQNQQKIEDLFFENKPRAIINFAAESHVDKSIEGPEAFINANILGTFSMLNAALNYYKVISKEEKRSFRFIHVSTDEVFGSLKKEDQSSNEKSAYKPNSPYSASKAASDHLVRAWFHTYGLPTITSNCTNNYGPRQFTEKLIPLMISNAVKGKKLPIYGDGKNIRDWLYVEDHCSAIIKILEKGKVGETYNIGGNSEKNNNEIVSEICKILDSISPREDKTSYLSQIEYVEDRAGHDFRYSLDISKINKELGWFPEQTFSAGLEKTIKWYLDNL